MFSKIIRSQYSNSFGSGFGFGRQFGRQFSNIVNVSKSKHKHPEYQYLNLVKNIIKYGDKREGRNGTTYSQFGYTMRFSLRNNVIPLLTTKRVAWKSCLHELFWFIQGHTNSGFLKDRGVKIWDGNSTREFLDSRGLNNYNENELGPIYGFQWRNFNGDYIQENQRNIYSLKNAKVGTDQLEYIIETLKGDNPYEDKYSRRLLVSAWNPNQINMMALPPCHVLFQFYVNSKDELSCVLYQRSGDVGLGVPFNIASYSFLTHLVAHHCGLKPGMFIHNIGDAHIYSDHIEPLKTQLKNKPYEFPKLEILKKRNNIDFYDFSDFKIEDYKCHKKIKMEMSA